MESVYIIKCDMGAYVQSISFDESEPCLTIFNHYAMEFTLYDAERIAKNLTNAGYGANFYVESMPRIFWSGNRYATNN